MKSGNVIYLFCYYHGCFCQNGNVFLKKTHSDITMISQIRQGTIGKLIMAVHDELKLYPDTSFILNISGRLGIHPELTQRETTSQGIHVNLFAKVTFVIEIWECSMGKDSFGPIVYTFIKPRYKIPSSEFKSTEE